MLRSPPSALDVGGVSIQPESVPQMGKSKRRKEKQKKRKAKRKERKRPSTDEGVVYFQPPQFHFDTPQQRDELVEQVREESRSGFDRALSAVSRLIVQTDPDVLLCTLSFQWLSNLRSDDPEMTEESPLLQHHVELLQAFALRTPFDEYVPSETPFDLFQLADHLRDLSRCFSWGRIFTDLGGAREDLPQRRVLEQIRTHTLAVRNLGYPQHVFSCAAGILRSLDSEFTRVYSVSAVGLVQMFSRLTMLMERRVNQYVSHLLAVGRARDLEEMIREYVKPFPERDELAQALLSSLTGVESKEEIAARLTSHSCYLLPAAYSLSLDDLAVAYPTELDRDAMKPVMESWSLEYGALRDHDTNRLFLDNPVWTRPFIRLDNGRYLLPIPGLLVSFCLELLEGLTRTEDSLNRRYLDARSRFLQDAVETLFRTALPKAAVYPQVSWDDPAAGVEGESDLLVVVGSHVLVVEAKSGRVTAPARRGARERTIREIKKLFVEPSDQGKRLIEHLQSGDRKRTVRGKNGEEIVIDCTGVRQFIRLTVTLDILADLQCCLWELKGAGLLDATADIAPVIALPDLQMVAEILSDPAEFVHYLYRRQLLETQLRYSGDEMDLLAYYLRTAFSIHGVVDGQLQLLNMSKTLDPYFLARSRGEERKKPKRRYTKWWKSMLDRLRSKRSELWLDGSSVLLAMSLDEQRKFERAFQKVKKNVRRRWRDPEHKCCVIAVTGAPGQQEALLGFAYRKLTRQERREKVEHLANKAVVENDLQRVAFVAVDIEEDRPTYVYSLFGCAYAARESTEQATENTEGVPA